MSAGGGERLSGLRGWHLAAASLLLFFGIGELALRAAGFTYCPFSDEFEITPEYRIFERRGEEWVTRPQKRASFLEQRFAARKAPGEVRVVLLGGSSVHNLGDAPLLREQLSASLAPGERLTVLNLGGRGYGTNRLRLHFQELLEYEPDLVIFYTGHNEFNETYLRDRFYDRGPLDGLDEALSRRSRFYQLLSFGIHELTIANLESMKRGTHPFFPASFALQWEETYDKQAMHQNYEDNLRTMLRLAEAEGLPVLLSTVAYNRRLPPFRDPRTTYAECDVHRQGGDFAGWRDCLEAAIDAGPHPIRATRTTNGIVREIARDYGVPLADVDARVVAASNHGVPGFQLFEDHCHLNDGGNAILQRTLAEAVLDAGLLSRH